MRGNARKEIIQKVHASEYQVGIKKKKKRWRNEWAGDSMKKKGKKPHQTLHISKCG